MIPLTRAAFLTGSLAALAGPALGAPTPPPLTTIRIGESADVDVSSVIWQVPNNIFSRLGLALEGHRLNTGSAASAAVVGGSLDIAASSIFGLMLAHLRGVPFVLQSVQAVYDSARPATAFVVAKDSPITTPAQLNGATISTAALGDLFSIATSAWVDQNGGNSKTLNFIELPVPSAAPAIAAGRVAGALLVEPFLQDGIDRGLIKVLGYPYNLIAPRFGITYYFCTQSYAASNVDLLARFRRGFVQQAAYAQRHKNEIYALAAKLSGASLDSVKHIPFIVAAGLDVRMIQPVIDYAAKYKFIPKAFPASEMVDPNAVTSG
jgi:NitT/TauT family transport system substrate-binding protein